MSRSVEEIRREIDTLDNRIHDLLMERAELVLRIGEEKKRNRVQVVQPDREAVMIRRLLARHKGPLPKEAVVRIWRELVGAVSLLQTGLRVAVAVPEDTSGLGYWDMAKDYFSSVLPMNKVTNPMAALGMVREGEATFAVVPWPENEEQNPWWRFLMDEKGDQAMRIMARLPLGDRSRAGANPEFRALVVAKVKYDTSGEDRSFIALQVDQTISRARIADKAKGLGLTARSAYSFDAKDGRNTLHLLEIETFIATDDERLRQLVEVLESAEGKCICLGGYPIPPVYDDKVGKNAAPAGELSAQPRSATA
jgi:chorismate mutase/prephenate dehydratase